MGPSDEMRRESGRPGRRRHRLRCAGPERPGRGVGAERRRAAGSSPSAKQQAQVDQILRAFPNDVGRGPAKWQEVGVQYLYRLQRILVRDEYVDQVLRNMDGADVDRSLIRGVTLLRVQEETLNAVDRVAPGSAPGWPRPTTSCRSAARDGRVLPGDRARGRCRAGPSPIRS